MQLLFYGFKKGIPLIALNATLFRSEEARKIAGRLETMKEEPIITPSLLLPVNGITSEDNQCSIAIMAFCPFYEMKTKAKIQNVEKSLFIHLDSNHQFQGIVEGQQVLMVDCVYGGPVCATIIEEMAYLGVKYLIGYGYAGSLHQNLPIGSIVLASAGLVSDGTSREYSDAQEVEPSEKLMEICRENTALGNQVVEGKAWTTDAFYREYPRKIHSWIHAGADFVNMDTSPLYAVSRIVGIETVYFAVISDYIGGERWEQQFRDIRVPRERLQEVILGLIPKIASL